MAKIQEEWEWEGINIVVAYYIYIVSWSKFGGLDVLVLHGRIGWFINLGLGQDGRGG